MSGVVESLTTDWRGATLLAAVGSVLTVDDVADFDEEGGWLTIADAAPVEYIAVDDDAATVTLAGTAGTVEAGDPVSVWDPSVPPSGAKVVEYLASVMTDRGPVDAVVEHEAIPFAGVDTLVGASVTLEEDAYGNPYVGRVLGREPVQDLSYADASTLDVSSLPPVPGGQTFSVDAPVATAGFPEDHGWWQVVDGKVLGFWRLIGGSWTTQAFSLNGALFATNAFIEYLTGKTLTGANIQTSNIPDQGIHLDALGLRAYGPGGGAPFMNVDPAAGLVIVAGEGTFDKLTTTGDVPAGESSAELGGVTEIKSGAKVKLTSGATAPTAAPTVDSSYDSVQFTADGQWGNRRGWSTDGTYWYTARLTDSNLWVEKWNAAGTLNATSGLLASGVGDCAGVAVIGSVVWVLSYSFVWVAQPRNTSTLSSAVGTGTWTQADGTSTPAFGADAATGELLIAQTRPSDLTIPNRVRIRRYTTGSDPLTAGASVDTDFAYSGDLAGVTYGTHDLGANRYVITKDGSQNFLVTNSSGAAVTAEDFDSGMTDKVGFTYTGGAFVSMDDTGLMRTYTGLEKATPIGHANLTKWVSSTNFRDEATDWETTQSPRKKFVQPKRSKLTVTTANLSATPGANDPNQVQVYVGQNETNTITNKVLAANVATLTTSVTHRYAVGNTVTVAIADAVFDGAKTITAVTATTFSYAKTNAPVGSTGATGTVTRTTDPGRTQMARQTTPAAGLTSTAYSTLTAPPGTNPPAANNFPDATPSQVELADGTVLFNSNGDGSAWKTYTPTFTASVTNPTLTNFTISGRYTRIGKTITFVALVTCDTAAGMGSGNYQFGLPITARATNEIVCIAQQSGPNHGYQGRGASTTTINLFLTSTDAVATVTSTGMAAATSIRITGTYEAA